MEKGLPPEHGGELFPDSFEELLKGRRVTDERRRHFQAFKVRGAEEKEKRVSGGKKLAQIEFEAKVGRFLHYGKKKRDTS